MFCRTACCSSTVCVTDVVLKLPSLDQSEPSDLLCAHHFPCFPAGLECVQAAPRDLKRPRLGVWLHLQPVPGIRPDQAPGTAGILGGACVFGGACKKRDVVFWQSIANCTVWLTGDCPPAALLLVPPCSASIFLRSPPSASQAPHAPHACASCQRPCR